MSNLREEITRTVLRLSRRGEIPRALDLPPRDLDLPPRGLPANSREGKQLGSYRILRRLGAGGMGHVYLALDTRLGRHVALKFLAHDTMADYSMLYRLQQEARTASALNHPNIVTVYEIGELDGEPFIASEFIDGATLRVALQRNAVDVPIAIDIAMQVASALVAAHSAGVVHRDLKPGNIMLRPDGYVKVIDFGLAKQIKKSALGHSGHDFITQPGSVLGTVDYMSPEQARGERVDHRTDIWSLGVVLYEMVANRRPFEGQTDSHVIVSILESTLPPLADSKTLPPGLLHILECALAKDPANRYSSAGEMLGDLQQISLRSQSGSGVRLAAFARRRRATRTKIVLIAGAVSLVLLSYAGWWWQARVPHWSRFELARALTFSGRIRLACISPDGKYLAFAVGDPGGREALYVKQLDSVSEELKIPARNIRYLGVTFSPDSRYVYEVEEDDTLEGKLYALPILGERPSTPVLSDIDGPVSFSPSGDQFIFERDVHQLAGGNNQTESDIKIADRNGSNQRTLASSGRFTFFRQPAWSPKGDQIAAILDDPGKQNGAVGSLMLDLIDLRGRETRKSLPNWEAVGRLWWTPNGASLLLTSATSMEGRDHIRLREILARTGQVHDLSRDLARSSSISLTQDGRALSLVRAEAKGRLWISAPGNFTTGQSAPAEAAEKPSLDWADDHRLITTSLRSGSPNLWLFDAATQTRTSLTNEPHVEQFAASIPGSTSIVFASNRLAGFHIWRFDPGSNTYTQLSFGPSYDDTPVVSPDAKWVVYTSWASTVPRLYRVPLAGGTATRIGNYVGNDPQISPDGQWIACRIKDSADHWSIALVPFGGGGARHVLSGAQLPIRWSPDGASVTSSLTDEKGVSNLWNIPLNGSPARQLTRFEDESILAFAWSPNGARLACLRSLRGADVVLLERQN